MATLAPILSNIEQAIDSAGAGLGAAATQGAIGRVFTLLLATSICLWAVKILQGKEESNPTSMAVQYFRYMLIAYIFASIYNPTLGFTVAGFITDLPRALGALVGVNVNAPAQIDAMYERAVTMTIQILDTAPDGIMEVKQVLIGGVIAFIVYMVSIVVCGISIAMFAMAKLMLKASILFAAVAFMMLLTDKTKQYFSSWLNFTTMVAVLFVVNSFMLDVVFRVMSSVFDMLFALASEGSNSEYPVSLAGLGGYCIAFAVCAFGISKAEQIAFSIGGSAGASAAGFVTLVMGGATSVVNKASGAAQGGLNMGRGALDAVRGYSGGGQGGDGAPARSNPNNTSLAYGAANLGTRAVMASGKAMMSAGKSFVGSASRVFGDGNTASGAGGNTVRPTTGRFDRNS